MSNTEPDLTGEQVSIDRGNNPKWLKRRLIDSKNCLKYEYRRHFKQIRFDFTNKCLIGTGGYSLVWTVRSYPDQPISYHNQQTNTGMVSLYRMEQVPVDELLQALLDLTEELNNEEN